MANGTWKTIALPRRHSGATKLKPVRAVKEIWLIDNHEPGIVKIIDEEGSLLQTRVFSRASDNLHYDCANQEWWFNLCNEGGAGDYIYRDYRWGRNISSTNISTAGYALEAVCYDYADDSIWTISDEAGTITLDHREKADPTSILATVNLSLIGILGPQDVCYDVGNDTLWIADNDDGGADYVGNIYNLDKAGNLLSTHHVTENDHSTLVGATTTLQGITYDDRDDTLWITARNHYIYHVTKNWQILSVIASPFVSGYGPSGIEIVPWGTRAAHLSPILSLRLYDNAATTAVAAQVGAVTALSGGDNTADKSTAGPIDKAFTFNGSDDYIAISPTLVGSTGWSISCWVYFSATISNEILFGDGAANEDWIRLTDNDTIALKVNNVSSVFNPGFTMSLDTWHHLVFSYNSADNKVYVYYDGLLQSTASGSLAPANNFTPVNIGNKQTEWFGGRMSNVLLFDYMLPQIEIDYLYNNGRGNDALDESVESYLYANINHIIYPELHE